jgi:hypothetical protein
MLCSRRRLCTYCKGRLQFVCILQERAKFMVKLKNWRVTLEEHCIHQQVRRMHAWEGREKTKKAAVVEEEQEEVEDNGRPDAQERVVGVCQSDPLEQSREVSLRRVCSVG